MAAIQGRKSGSKEPRTPVEAPDSVRSVARAKMLVALGEGEFAGGLDGTLIFLNDTPLISANGTENFPGVKWEFRPGTQHQEHIAGLPSVENEIAVGVELRSEKPWVRDLSDPALSAARIRVSFPALQQRLANGDVTGYRIDYVIEVSTAGNGWAQALSATIHDKTTTKYERSHRVELPESDSGWSIRIRRLTANQNNNDVADIMRVESITEVIDAKLRYPNTALLYIEFDASQFQNLPKVSCEPRMRIIRVPSNYDPASRSYSGIWDGTFKWAWTDNPAWVLFDIILNKRFGMGRRLDTSMVDRWELYQIAQYCDELVSDGNGGLEPRFTCNVYIQEAADAWDVLRDIAAIFRGITYWSGREMVAQADMPSDMEYLFSRSSAKVVDGKIKYGAQSERSRYSSVLVGYDNQKNRYESEPEPVSIPSLIRRYGFNQTQITAIGCVRQSEANRRGRWLLLTNAVDRSITFSTGLDGYLPKPGRIIGMADAFLAGREFSGRISLVSGRQITLDRDAKVQVGDRLLVNLPSGRAEARTVQSVTKRTVTVTTAYSETPKAQAQWGVESNELLIQQYRVTAVSRNEKGFEISGVMTDPGKYAQVDSGTRLESRPISVIPARTQDSPTAVKVSRFTRVVQGIAVTTLRAEWEAAKGAIAYTAEWRKDSGEWVPVPRTSGLGFEVAGIYSGRYVVRVRAVNVMDVSSLFAYSEETQLNGKEGLPPAVSFLTTTSLVYGIGIQWGFPPGAEDTERTEIWYSESPDLTTAEKLSDFSYPQSKYEMRGQLPGSLLFFWARLVDRTGNEGPFFPIQGAVNGQASTDRSEYAKLFANQIDKGALYPGLREEIELISGDGDGSVNERLKEAKEELEGLLGQITGAEPYNPDEPYTAGAFTRVDGRLYQATGPVPAGEAPPNPLYWKDIGTILQTTDALAQQVQLVTSMIEEIEGQVVATATSVEALRSAARGDDGAGDLADAVKGWQSTADLGIEKRTRASESDAMARQLTTLNARVGANQSGLTVLEQVVATNKQTAATQLTQLKSDLELTEGKVAGNAQAITGLDTKVTNLDGKVTSQASSNEALRASVRGDDGSGDLAGAIKAWESTTSFEVEKKVQATATEALAKRTETLQSSIGQTSASVQAVSETVVQLDGKVSAQTTMKAQTIVDGRKVVTGLAFGSDGEQSEFLIFAQRFAVVNEIDGTVIPMFVVQNNQVVFNTAIISKALIQEIILGMTLRSEDVDSRGRPLLEINVKSGTFALRGDGTGGSILLNNNGLAVYDGNDVRRTMTGNLRL